MGKIDIIDDERVIVIRPDDYRARLKEYALRLAEQFDRDITVEINVDKVNKNVNIKVIVHRF